MIIVPENRMIIELITGITFFFVSYYAGWKDGHEDETFKTFKTWGAWIWNKIKKLTKSE